MKALPSYFACGYKKNVYRADRIVHPLKRVDWEPGGDASKINAQNRGISKYKQITMNEALDILASEIKRIHDNYGLTGILAMADGHGEVKCVHQRACLKQLLDRIGGYTDTIRNADSWEGWHWGAKWVWGGVGVCGMLMPTTGVRLEKATCIPDVAQNC